MKCWYYTKQQKEKMSTEAKKLVEKKWAKFTTSCMGEFYKADGLYDDLTAEQKEIYEKYFDV